MQHVNDHCFAVAMTTYHVISHTHARCTCDQSIDLVARPQEVRWGVHNKSNKQESMIQEQTRKETREGRIGLGKETIILLL